MANFAKVKDGIVTKVIVAEQEFIDSYIDNIPGKWIQTSYNTYGGVHRLGGTPLRKNFAGVGYTYDSMKDVFIPPKPFNSWTLNEDTCLWNAPVAMPATELEENQYYSWNESIINWEIKTK
jgi:hypothetical protein